MRRPDALETSTQQSEAAKELHRVGVLTGSTARGKSDILASLYTFAAALGKSVEVPETTKTLASPTPGKAEKNTSFSLLWLADGRRYDLRLVVDKTGIIKESLRVRTDSMWIPLYTRTGANQFFHAESGVEYEDSSAISDLITPWTLTMSAWASVDHRSSPHTNAISWVTESIVLVPPPFEPEEANGNRQWMHMLMMVCKNPKLLSSLKIACSTVEHDVKSIVLEPNSYNKKYTSEARVINACLAKQEIPHSHRDVQITPEALIELMPRVTIYYNDGSKRVVNSKLHPVTAASHMFTAAVFASARINQGLVMMDLSHGAIDLPLLAAAASTATVQSRSEELQLLPPAQFIVAVHQNQAPEVLARALEDPIITWRVDPVTGGQVSCKRNQRSVVPAGQEGSEPSALLLDYSTEVIREAPVQKPQNNFGVDAGGFVF